MSIADLIEEMANDGAPLVSIVRAVRALEEKDQAAAAERAKAAERKRRQRERDSHGTVTATSQDKGSPVDGPSLSPAPLTHPLNTPSKTSVRRTDCEELVEEWNRMAKANGLSTVTALNPDRRTKLKARLAEHGREKVIEAIGKVGRSPHCRGENDRGWKAGIDFLIASSSFLKIIEGNYDPPKVRQPANEPGRPGMDFVDRVLRQSAH